MQRVLEPELMDDELQARAYAQADFAEPHSAYPQLFLSLFKPPPQEATLPEPDIAPRVGWMTYVP